MTLKQIATMLNLPIERLREMIREGHFPAPTRPEAAVTVGQRLTWVRELMEPFAPLCAAVMRISTTQWQRYEDGKDALPVEVAREFAHRFSVDLDYLYSGNLDGVAPVVRDNLIARHPVLDSPRRRATRRG